MTRGRQPSSQQVVEEMAVEVQSLLHDVERLHEEHLHHDKWEIHTERQIAMNQAGAMAAIHQGETEEAVGLLEQNQALFEEWFKRDALENRRHREALVVLEQMGPLLRHLSSELTRVHAEMVSPGALRAVGL